MLQLWFSTLVNAYAQIITSMSKVAQDHVQLADTITTRVTEPLKALERQNEGLKRKVRAACCSLPGATSLT